MVNLLGDIWKDGEPRWDAVLRHGGAHLHLYGKREPRRGRKMGHVTVCEPAPETAMQVALAIRRDLGIAASG
jgi:5-(carboxyamino)imidazole ribonucleotide synthase